MDNLMPVYEILFENFILTRKYMLFGILISRLWFNAKGQNNNPITASKSGLKNLIKNTH